MRLLERLLETVVDVLPVVPVEYQLAASRSELRSEIGILEEPEGIRRELLWLIRDQSRLAVHQIDSFGGDGRADERLLHRQCLKHAMLGPGADTERHHDHRRSPEVVTHVRDEPCDDHTLTA